VTVLVPYRADSIERTRSWEWVEKRYIEHLGPAHQIVRGTCAGEWCKAEAVTDALQHANDRVLVIADSDCWSDGIWPAYDAVLGGAPWAIPHEQVLRLSSTQTENVIPGGRLKNLDLERWAYPGVPGGGIVVIRRDVYEQVPLDPRFRGWGGEDWSWGRALWTLVGSPVRFDYDLFHLWHPPQPRAVTYRNAGSETSEQLRRRYDAATDDPEAMAALIEEAHAHQRPPHPDLHDHARLPA
jgi:hypothetical protein